MVELFLNKCECCAIWNEQIYGDFKFVLFDYKDFIKVLQFLN